MVKLVQFLAKKVVKISVFKVKLCPNFNFLDYQVKIVEFFGKKVVKIYKLMNMN